MEEVALKGPIMSSHMMGKVTPGGVQDGWFLSMNPSLSPSSTAFLRSGRVLLSGLNTLDLSENT